MSDNPLKLKSIHHVEFWVGNAKQAAYFYRQAFGFSQIAYAGLETGQRDHTSYALSQGKARLVVTSPLDSAGPIATPETQATAGAGASPAPAAPPPTGSPQSGGASPAASPGAQSPSPASPSPTKSP